MGSACYVAKGCGSKGGRSKGLKWEPPDMEKRKYFRNVTGTYLPGSLCSSYIYSYYISDASPEMRENARFLYILGVPSSSLKRYWGTLANLGE